MGYEKKRYFFFSFWFQVRHNEFQENVAHRLFLDIPEVNSNARPLITWNFN